MADRQLKVTVVGDTRNLERSLGRAETKMKRFERSGVRGALAGSGAFSSLGRSVAFASSSFLGGAGLTYAIKSSVAAAMESQRVLAQTKNAVQQGGDSWAQYRKQITAAATSESQLAGFDDERLLQTFQNLYRTTGNVSKALRLNALSADVARGRNIELESAAQLVTKASIGQIGALRRVGINIDKNATSAQALDLLQRKYAGSAETYGRTAAGAMDRFHVSIENVQELIGKALLPEMTKLVNKANDWLANPGNQKRISDDAEKTAKFFGAAAAHLGDMADTIKSIAEPQKGPPSWYQQWADKTQSRLDHWVRQSSLIYRTVRAATGYDPLKPKVGPAPELMSEHGGGQGAFLPGSRAGGGKAAGSGIPGHVSGTGGRSPFGPGASLPYREFQLALAAGTKARTDDEQVLRVIVGTLKQRLGWATTLKAKTEIQNSLNQYQGQLSDLLGQDAKALKDSADAAKAAKQKILAARKKEIAAFKHQADAIKNAVLDALGNKETRINNARALADAKAAMKVARRLGGPEGIKLAKRDLVDAQMAVKRQRIEEMKFGVKGGKGGPTVAAGGVTINIHGITDPDAVAKRVIAVLNRHGRQTSPQTRGRAPGHHGI